MRLRINAFLFLFLLFSFSCVAQTGLRLNNLDYFEQPGLNVMVFSDYYPDGHQTGVTIIQRDVRVAANGDVRLEAAPGQWSPVPVVGKRDINRNENEISVALSYPDPEKDRKGFNPIIYPDLNFNYSVRVQASENSFKIVIDLSEPVPDEWVGKIGFNLELFPGVYFGKSFLMDNNQGVFPRQVNGPSYYNSGNELLNLPLAAGNKLIVAPENEECKITFTSEQKLYLLDGRVEHNNGWFIIRSLIPAGKTKNALEWIVTPSSSDDWLYDPVVQISQIGYHPDQGKIAVIELDKNDPEGHEAELISYDDDGNSLVIKKELPVKWGEFIRYKYYEFDFSDVKTPGIYQVKYGDYITSPFKISGDVFSRHVWQPTLEYFLPVQMCHMRVNDRYRVWHGLCHEDDALMAPTDYNHFDGYMQGASTLTSYKSNEHVPDLNSGGWHDAGDYDLRVESQAGTVHTLALAFEEFNETHDETTIDQFNKVVEIHRPDGKADILQQIEHGVLTIVNGYNSLGRLYRGIICPTIRQYTLLGDASVMTDNQVYTPDKNIKDDRWVFTEINPGRELYVAGALASAARSLKNYNYPLATECLRISRELWQNNIDAGARNKIFPAVELLLSTGEYEYREFLISQKDEIIRTIESSGWLIGRADGLIGDAVFTSEIEQAVADYHKKIENQQNENPYGVPYKPNIWGAGWDIQKFGVRQYFLNKYFPEIFPDTYMLNALNFILGCHPGSNTSSFASGVGAKSLTVAYGVNRADWSYIPGGVASGTALIRPDLPELKEWPFFWQQAEYVMGGGATDFMFLVLAADHKLN